MSVGYLQLLRENRSFRLLWSGEVVSFLGDWFNTIAIYTAVQRLAPSGQALAAVMISKTLPAFLVMPIAGPLIDRFDRRRLLLVTDLIRAACVVGLIISYRAESLVGLFTFTVLMMFCAGIAFPAKNAVLPRVVQPQNLAVANALSGGSWSVMLALGSALGGIATQLVGVEWSFAIDGMTFLISFFFFMGLPRLEPPASKGASKRETSFLEGLRYLWRTPYFLLLAMLKPMMALSGGVLVLIPVFGTSAFSGYSGPLWVGLLYASRGLGALCGSLVMRTVFGDTPRTLRRLILGGYVCIAIFYTLIGVGESFWVTAVGLFGGALGTGMIWVFSGTLLQGEADPAYHGRTFSLEFGLTTLLISAASWGAGAALDGGAKTSQIAITCGLIALAPALLWGTTLLIVKRRIRQRVLERLRFNYEAAAAECHEVARYGAGASSEIEEPAKS